MTIDWDKPLQTPDGQPAILKQSGNDEWTVETVRTSEHICGPDGTDAWGCQIVVNVPEQETKASVISDQDRLRYLAGFIEGLLERMADQSKEIAKAIMKAMEKHP